PDLVAPGVGVTSALAGGGYAAVTGTSAAAAQVAGDAALVLDAHPRWTPALVRGALVGTAAAVPSITGTWSSPVEAVEGQGGGQADGHAAITAQVVADPATISFGLALADPYTASATLVVHNVSRHPATIRLGFQRDHVGDVHSAATLGADQPE